MIEFIVYLGRVLGLEVPPDLASCSFLSCCACSSLLFPPGTTCSAPGPLHEPVPAAWNAPVMSS